MGSHAAPQWFVLFSRFQIQESSSTEAADMKSAWLCCLLALVSIASSGQHADAAYCGLASYKHDGTKMTTVSFAQARDGCSSCETSASEPSCASKPSCCGTRLVKDVVYEQKQYTCYKTICEKVVEQKQIDCVRYETEKSFKEVEYTVCKPVWETRSRTTTTPSASRCGRRSRRRSPTRS